MKKTLSLSLVLMFALFVSSAIIAQPPGGGRMMDPEVMAKRQTEMMQKELGLDKETTEKLAEINLKYSKKMMETFKEMRESGSFDREKMREKMTKLDEEKNKELKKIFTEEQYEKYEKLMKEMREKRPGRPGGR